MDLKQLEHLSLHLLGHLTTALTRQYLLSQGLRHVSFVNSDRKQIEEDGRDSRRIGHIPHFPRLFPTCGDHRRSSFVERLGGRKKPPASAGPMAAVAALPRRAKRPGHYDKPGEFAKPKTTLKFNVEFDFDKALQEFKRLSLHESDNRQPADAESVDVSTKDVCKLEEDNNSSNCPKEVYNREKCFYDNLSSASVAQGQMRRSRKEEIMVNKETFGVSWLPSHRRCFNNGRSNFYECFNMRRLYGGRSFNRRTGRKK